MKCIEDDGLGLEPEIFCGWRPKMDFTSPIDLCF